MLSLGDNTGRLLFVATIHPTGEMGHSVSGCFVMESNPANANKKINIHTWKTVSDFEGTTFQISDLGRGLEASMFQHCRAYGL